MSRLSYRDTIPGIDPDDLDQDSAQALGYGTQQGRLYDDPTPELTTADIIFSVAAVLLAIASAALIALT